MTFSNYKKKIIIKYKYCNMSTVYLYNFKCQIKYKNNILKFKCTRLSIFNYIL